MKKIGIVSVDANTPMFNYGAILHTWAFEQFLLKNGYNNFETLNYYPEAVEFQNRLFPIIDFFTDCHRKLSLKYCMHYFQYLKKYKVIKRFVDNHMHLSTKKYRYSTINKQKLDYDILIAEDDVIWAPTFLCRKELVDKTFFLAHPNMNCKKIAYAPSMAQCNFKPEEYKIIRSYLEDFDHIAVREKYEQKFIKDKLKLDVDQCLDAVFLLDKEEYIPIISNKFMSKKFVFVYLPADNNLKLREAARKYAADHDLEVIEITNQICSSKNVYGDAGVEDFLSAIYYSECIFTNSFHAICFSVIFEKQFYVFTRENSGKLKDICDLLSLNNRFCFDESIVKEPIDYNIINKIVNEKKEYSKSWLLNAIEK